MAKLTVTSSFGASTARLGDSVQTLLERADSALYRAKETGRNRTCWEGQVDDEPSSADSVFDETEPKISEVDGKLQFTETVPVSTSLELTAMKLNAFLSSQNVRITHQERGVIKLQSGGLGLLGCWGSTPARQPVNIDIRFETTRNTDLKTGHSKTLRFVVVTIVPVGRVSDADMFESRCIALMQHLRSYLLSS